MAIAVAPLTLVLLLLSLCLPAKASYIAYNTSATIVPGKINVHLVPHSHDDVGWLKTVDQYYVGANNSIRVRACPSISVLLTVLHLDVSHCFVSCELGYDVS